LLYQTILCTFGNCFQFEAEAVSKTQSLSANSRQKKILVASGKALRYYLEYG